ncbi:MAG: type II toxin-antitoxin system RelE/ParE family toxin [Armatimonadetes bacterium]|nr:type II toxin-antitoxin system RelE/ParE family toxin [Armatimonadota bacterium]
MIYEFRVEQTAIRQLNRLPKPVRVRLWRKIKALPSAPRPPGTKALDGALKPLRSLRVGDYGAIYRVDDEARVVRVTHTGHRSRVYTDAERGA